jgi:hypothetical protein
MTTLGARYSVHIMRVGVGARYSVTSCDLCILMDQSTKSITSHDAPSRQGDRWFGGPERWCLPQGAVRTVAV